MFKQPPCGHDIMGAPGVYLDQATSPLPVCGLGFHNETIMKPSCSASVLNGTVVAFKTCFGLDEEAPGRHSEDPITGVSKVEIELKVLL